MSDRESPESIDQSKISRRDFLKAGAVFAGGLALGTGAGFVGGRLFPEPTPAEVRDEYKDFETLGEVVDQFINKDADPSFWSDFESLLKSGDQSKINDKISRYSKSEDGSFEVHYFPDGISPRNPEVYFVVIEPHELPQGSAPEGGYKSRAVLISYGLDENGNVMRAGHPRATAEESEQFIDQHFKVPTKLRETPWQGDNQGTVRRYPDHDRVDQLRYQQEIRSQNVTFTAWYPETENAPIQSPTSA